MFIINLQAQSSNHADRVYYVVDLQCMQPGAVKLIISTTQIMDYATTVFIITAVDHTLSVIKSQKSFQMKTSAYRDGVIKNQPNKIGTTPQHIYIIPTSCAILPTIYALCLLVVCIAGLTLWKAVGGIAGCVVHVDVCGECVSCGWMQRSCY